MRFAKGHGTGNDFVVLCDRDDLRPLSAEVVRFLCDRHEGIGGDGVLRAVKAQHIPEWSGNPELWFMDYRNGDGSIAEICGNGLRVFVRFLREEGLIDCDQITIGTRAGMREAEVLADGQIRVNLGQVEVSNQQTTIGLGAESFAAIPVDVGNPHAVVMMEDVGQIGELDLTVEPVCDAAVFPEGVNVEFVAQLDDSTIAMRVHERGSGETLSCGTGVVAAAAAWAKAVGHDGDEITVAVPGGLLRVNLSLTGAKLSGPAVIVAHGEARIP